MMFKNLFPTYFLVLSATHFHKHASAIECPNARLVKAQTGPDSACGGGSNHFWPVDYGINACHAWEAFDTDSRLHTNSAKNMRCEGGKFKFTQYVGNLNCAGTGVGKVIGPDCEQDSPPTLYTMGVDLSCCINPGGADCQAFIGQPSALEGSEIFLDGEKCDGSGQGESQGGGQNGSQGGIFGGTSQGMQGQGGSSGRPQMGGHGSSFGSSSQGMQGQGGSSGRHQMGGQGSSFGSSSQGMQGQGGSSGRPQMGGHGSSFESSSQGQQGSFGEMEGESQQGQDGRPGMGGGMGSSQQGQGGSFSGGMDGGSQQGQGSESSSGGMVNNGSSIQDMLDEKCPIFDCSSVDNGESINCDKFDGMTTRGRRKNALYCGCCPGDGRLNEASSFTRSSEAGTDSAANQDVINNPAIQRSIASLVVAATAGVVYFAI